MNRKLTVGLVIAVLAVGGWAFSGHWLPQLDAAWARGGMGWGGGCPMSYRGTPGGSDFAPQRGYGNQAVPNNGVALSPERARDIAANHISRLNPSLKLGPGRDAGAYYQFDVLAQGKTVDRLAVDKANGMVHPVN
ncbi:MAG: hypothetical protein KQI62_03760 [Deltaproteobacteria bacterium]|nr:hypothetical protein [Deltaproteobacteria bacterium]